MGQHEYGDRPLGNPLEADFVAVTRALNYVGKRIELCRLHFGNVLLAVESLEKFNLQVVREREGKEEGEGEVWVEEMIGELRGECRSLILMAEYEEKRTGTLIQVVSHLTLSIIPFLRSSIRYSTDKVGDDRSINSWLRKTRL
jgi:hypothetical protein